MCEAEKKGRERERGLDSLHERLRVFASWRSTCKRPASRHWKITAVMMEWRRSGPGLVDCGHRQEVSRLSGASDASTPPPAPRVAMETQKPTGFPVEFGALQP